jgi:hypothetical protein
VVILAAAQKRRGGGDQARNDCEHEWAISRIDELIVASSIPSVAFDSETHL